jgi:hypothetical protein
VSFAEPVVMRGEDALEAHAVAAAVAAATAIN